VISRLGFGESNIEDIRDFKFHLINGCKQEKVQVALFLDEIDGLIALDREHQGFLFKALRSLYQENYLVLVIAGYEELFFSTKDIKSPLFNFLEVLKLTPLDRDSCARLITEPMKELGIEYKEPLVIFNEICSITSCFPNLVQTICSQLIKLIGAKKRRQIVLSDVKEVIEKAEFQNSIIDMFFQHLSSLSKIIVLLTMDALEFDLNQLNKNLHSLGIELKLAELSEELDKIILASLISREKTTYRYELPQFPTIFKNTIDPKLLLRQLQKEIK